MQARDLLLDLLFDFACFFGKSVLLVYGTWEYNIYHQPGHSIEARLEGYQFLKLIFNTKINNAPNATPLRIKRLR